MFCPITSTAWGREERKREVEEEEGEETKEGKYRREGGGC